MKGNEMRHLTNSELTQRGCAYCAHIKSEKINGIMAKFCPFGECPYHELDEHKSYLDYLKDTYNKQGLQDILKAIHGNKDL